MKPPSKKLWIALIAAVLIVIVITLFTRGEVEEAEALRDADVVFISNTDTPIGCVRVEYPRWDGSAAHETSMNADTSPLERGDKLYFEANWPATVTIYADIQGREPLGSVIIEEAPHSVEQEGVWYVIAQDGPEGVDISLSLNLNEDELVKMAESISKNLGVDVTGGHISCCWYPGHGWQGDGEDFVTLRFSQEAADELEDEIAETEGWERFPVPEEMKDVFDSVYTHESHIDWAHISDSGWFYFRDEQEKRHSAQSDDLYDSWDYVAAVYDTATRTLYFFEWHQ